MRIVKQKLYDLEKCYCVARLPYRGEPHYLVASEKQHACLLFDREGRLVDEVWQGPGGTMSMVWVPGTDGVFLATHKFYSPNDSKEASIVLVRPQNGRWDVTTLAALPHVHRFDILKRNGARYLIASTICSGRDFKDDWSYPGKVYAALLPEGFHDAAAELDLRVIKEGLVKNHGYCRLPGGESCLVTGEEGVFRFTAPEAPGGAWGIQTLLEAPVSDAVLLDMDGDGREELVTIAPFHGADVSVYRLEQGIYKKAYAYPEEFTFGHAICAATVLGKPGVLLGARQGKRDLIFLRHGGTGEGAYAADVIDTDSGCANILCDSVDHIDTLWAANREMGEIAMYKIYP